LTVKAVALVCARAAEQDDLATLNLFSYILNEECGNGQPALCHTVLMENSHNLFGQIAFDLDPLRVTAAKHSPLIIESTKRYRERIQELGRASYQRLLGVAMALESHAEVMLSRFRAAFRAHAECVDRRLFVDEIEVYFNVHLDQGVEQRHASDARECVSRNCRTSDQFAEIAYGAFETLEAQFVMWRDLYQRAIEIRGECHV
jgi:hypothetical protein